VAVVVVKALSVMIADNSSGSHSGISSISEDSSYDGITVSGKTGVSNSSSVDSGCS
jgi:hypothetical protein